MTLSDYALLAEIVSSIGVIASLIYVSIQLKQNTLAKQAESRHAVMSSSVSELFEIMHDSEIMILVLEKEDLSPIEQAKLNAYFGATFRAREYSWLQFQNGIIDKPQWKTELTVIQNVFLDSVKVRIWWENLGKLSFSKEFSEFIDKLISEQPATNKTFKLITSWYDNEKDKDS